MWARIDNGVVIEVTDSDPSGRFAPSLVWVKCPADTGQGMLYNGGNFEKAPPVAPEFLATEARLKRDSLLRDVYDVGIIRARREERMGVDVSERIEFLDAYALALLDVPQQEGFPHSIIWPETPV